MTATLVNHCLILSGILFGLGVIGVVVKRNIIVMLMSVELMLNSANLALIAYAAALQNMTGRILVLFVMVVAAAEAAIGLATLISVYKHKATVNIEEYEELTEGK